MDNLLTSNHKESLTISELTIVARLCIQLSEYDKFVSSANNMKCKTDELSTMSLIYIRNNKGPNIEPWGTPQETLLESEKVSFIHTY